MGVDLLSRLFGGNKGNGGSGQREQTMRTAHGVAGAAIVCPFIGTLLAVQSTDDGVEAMTDGWQ